MWQLKMKFEKYITENAVQKALAIKEPEVAKKYNDNLIKKYKDMIESALAEAEKMEDSDSKDAIVADLEDKLDKWNNVNKETTAPKPPPPEGEKEVPPEEDAEAEAEKEEDEKAKEEDAEAEEKAKEEEEDEKEKKKKKKNNESLFLDTTSLCY